MSHKKTFCAASAAVLAILTGGAAQAQDSLNLYGTIDEYLNYMRSSSGAKIRALEDGAYQRSRLGVRGTEDLGDRYFAKFLLEMGFIAPTGSTADTARFFDRQAWVGLGSPTLGEFRVGRQNTAAFARGDAIDFTARTLGSIVNTFGVPSRYDNDLAYLSPRWAGVMLEAHYALSAAGNGANEQAIYQLAVDYTAGPYRVGYAGLRGRAPSAAAFTTDVKYDNVYANYDYGAGKIYLAFVRSNNNTSAAAGNNTGAILGNTGGVVAGTNPDVDRFYNITQLAVDYKVTSNLRVGALWGRISDRSGRGRSASGGVIGAYYDLSKRTTLYALLDRIDNNTNAGFRPAGSAALPFNFTNPNDVNGRKIDGVQTGILHRF